MKNVIVAAMATGLSAAVLGLAAPAVAAPMAGDNAQQTISQLEAQGNRVIVKRQSSAPLSDATIVAVRPGPEIKDWVTVEGRQGDDRQHTDRVLETVGRIYFVDVM